MRTPSVVLLIAGVAVVATGCHRAQAESGDANVPVVPVAKATRSTLSSELTLTAEFVPYQEVDVMAKIAGYVHTIPVDIGDRVKEGQLLATLEVPEMEDDLAKAGAALQAAAADVAAAQDEVQRAKAARDLAKLSSSRLEEVAKKEVGLVPRQEVDVAQSHALEAEAQLAGATSRLTAAEQRSRVAVDEQTRLRTLFKYATITAPFAGVVTKRYADTGSMIQAGTSSQTQAMPLVRLSQNDLLRLRLPVPESAVPSVFAGQAVDVRVPALNRVFQGHVTRFAEKIQLSTRTMDTEVDVPNPDLLIVPGMYAEVSLHLDDHKGVVSVPLDAVVGVGDAAQLYVLDVEETLHLRPVKVGLENAQRVEIRSGVSEGDTVVVGRHAGLQEGEKVKAKVATYEAEAEPHGHGS